MDVRNIGQLEAGVAGLSLEEIREPVAPETKTFLDVVCHNLPKKNLPKAVLLKAERQALRIEHTKVKLNFFNEDQPFQLSLAQATELIDESPDIFAEIMKVKGFSQRKMVFVEALKKQKWIWEKDFAITIPEKAFAKLGVDLFKHVLNLFPASHTVSMRGVELPRRAYQALLEFDRLGITVTGDPFKDLDAVAEQAEKGAKREDLERLFEFFRVVWKRVEGRYGRHFERKLTRLRQSLLAHPSTVKIIASFFPRFEKLLSETEQAKALNVRYGDSLCLEHDMNVIERWSWIRNFMTGRGIAEPGMVNPNPWIGTSIDVPLTSFLKQCTLMDVDLSDGVWMPGFQGATYGMRVCEYRDLMKLARVFPGLRTRDLTVETITEMLSAFKTDSYNRTHFELAHLFDVKDLRQRILARGDFDIDALLEIRPLLNTQEIADLLKGLVKSSKYSSHDQQKLVEIECLGLAWVRHFRQEGFIELKPHVCMHGLIGYLSVKGIENLLKSIPPDSLVQFAKEKGPAIPVKRWLEVISAMGPQLSLEKLSETVELRFTDSRLLSCPVVLAHSSAYFERMFDSGFRVSDQEGCISMEGFEDGIAEELARECHVGAVGPGDDLLRKWDAVHYYQINPSLRGLFDEAVREFVEKSLTFALRVRPMMGIQTGDVRAAAGLRGKVDFMSLSEIAALESPLLLLETMGLRQPQKERYHFFCEVQGANLDDKAVMRDCAERLFARAEKIQKEHFWGERGVRLALHSVQLQKSDERVFLANICAVLSSMAPERKDLIRVQQLMERFQTVALVRANAKGDFLHGLPTGVRDLVICGEQPAQAKLFTGTLKQIEVRLPNLRMLVLQGMDVQVGRFDGFQRLKNLEEIAMIDCIGSLWRFKDWPMPLSLKGVFLDGIELKARTLEALLWYTEISHLRLGRANLTEDHIECLSRYHQIKSLDLSYNRRLGLDVVAWLAENPFLANLQVSKDMVPNENARECLAAIFRPGVLRIV